MNDTLLQTPILFIVFNRINTTKQVFETIQQAKPSKLYITSDGAREYKKNEPSVVNEVRNYILQNINWDCEVHTLFREKNLSCGPSVKEAIDWFFEHEEYGIILEDDTKPNTSFFRFCDELLIRYKDDERIGMISGNNHINFTPPSESYVFSKFAYTWGWATWRRAWENMDLEMNWHQTTYKNSIINNMGYTQKSITVWKENLILIKNHKVNAWDYQWFFSLSSQNQLCIFPACNLVSNIGFGEDATHTLGIPKEEYLKQKELSFPLIHPPYTTPLMEFEKKYEQIQIHLAPLWKRMIPIGIKTFIKQILKNSERV